MTTIDMPRKQVLPLRDYQIDDLAFYIEQAQGKHPKCLNLSDPGTGKTPSVVVNQQRRWQYEQKRTVWVQPKSLLSKNRDEILAFTDFVDDDVAIVDGTPKQCALALNSGAKVLLMGRERFKRVELPSDVLALDVDEMHMVFGGPQSAATDHFWRVNRKMHEGVGMTGTLVNGRLDSVYPAIHAIEPRYYSSYRGFLYHHAILDGYDRPVAWKNHKRITKILAKHSIRRTFTDVYGPEAKVIINEPVEMSPRQRGLYEKFEKELMIDLGEAILDGTAAPHYVLRARQILELPFSLPDPLGGPRVNLLGNEPSGKEAALDVHFADHARSGKPLVVFAVFVEQQRRSVELAKAAGLRVALMNGDTSTKERGAIDRAFRAGQIDCIICSPQVAAVGFNWQFWGPDGVEVDHVIFASVDYLDTTFFQAYRRFIRQARSCALRITVLMYRNTVDERVMRKVKDKSTDANRIDSTREVYDLRTSASA